MASGWREMAKKACLSTTLRIRNGTQASYELPETVQRQWPQLDPTGSINSTEREILYDKIGNSWCYPCNF